jgi:predicted metal-binding protein
MREEKLPSKREIFICNHHRPGEESCSEKGAKELTDNLKKWAKSETQGALKVYRGGCLGKCSEGIAMAIYPEKKLLLQVALEDEVEIQRGLLEEAP